jgi:small-conductance mechanosensitive channel
MTLGETLGTSNLPVLSDATIVAIARVSGALAVVVGAVLARRFIRRAIRGPLTRARVAPEARLVIDRAVQISVLIATATWVLDLLGLQLGALGTLLGISGVAVGLATQDVLKQLVAGVYLMMERPFTLGDRVSLPVGQGTVRRIELLSTVVGLDDGGAVVVPNTWFMANAVVARNANTPGPVKVLVTIRASNPEVADAASLVGAFQDCLNSCGLTAGDGAPEVRLRGWTAEGPVVLVDGTSVDPRAAVDALAWALRGRFGADLLELKDA